MNAHIQVRDYMLHEMPVIYGDTSLSKVTEILCSNNLFGLPVVDREKKLIGFISEQDCIHELLTSSYHCDFDLMASDVMHHEVLTVSPNDGIIELAESMQGNKPKIYPVVEEGQLLGIINRTRILKALRENLRGCHIPV
ncbi:CBS domain-containing protein [Endozoicomonas sp. Mp262]|uniref:CBS domain-containing protein n=1 Tax=Endozoicomonas sp. Mp262 TaxID=2919499 RepID=UPI0021DB2E85